MKVALIPCATTEWCDEGRLLGRVELQSTSDGQRRCADWVEQLRGVALARIYHSPDGLAAETAELLGRRLSIPVKPLDDLVEVDVGLWAGLTESQLKSRFASAHRQLCDSPLNVQPPEGETFSAAEKRVRKCIKKRIRKNGKTSVGLVLRPLSLAMAHCALQGTEPTGIWETAQLVREPVVVDCDRAPAPIAES